MTTISPTAANLKHKFPIIPTATSSKHELPEDKMRRLQEDHGRIIQQFHEINNEYQKARKHIPESRRETHLLSLLDMEKSLKRVSELENNAFKATNDYTLQVNSNVKWYNDKATKSFALLVTSILLLVPSGIIYVAYIASTVGQAALISAILPNILIGHAFVGLVGGVAMYMNNNYQYSKVAKKLISGPESENLRNEHLNIETLNENRQKRLNEEAANFEKWKADFGITLE